jgi:hypothetical protein
MCGDPGRVDPALARGPCGMLTGMQGPSDTTPESASAAWREAGSELRLDVVAPYRLVDQASVEPIECVALVRAFGSAKGTILLDLGSTTSAHHDAVSRLGFFATRINVLAYSKYQRAAFVDTLNDWGWFGPEEQRPAWYTGQPWT